MSVRRRSCYDSLTHASCNIKQSVWYVPLTRDRPGDRGAEPGTLLGCAVACVAGSTASCPVACGAAAGEASCRPEEVERQTAPAAVTTLHAQLLCSADEKLLVGGLLC